jgi:transcriptional regulator with XRE-family HTH domain
MTATLEEVLAEESEESRARIRHIADAMRAEIDLRAMRRLRKLTQARLSKKLKIGQEGVSRIEKRTDLYLSTLRSYVEGVGGRLTLMVEFPDQQPVILSGLGEDEGKKKAKKPAKSKAKNKAEGKPRSRRVA